jgi:serine/threonine protein kinase
MVYQGVNDKNQNFVAIKATKLSKLNKSPKLKELIKTEINVLKQCNNDNVIKYLDSFYSNEYLFIVTEYCNEGDLETYLANKKRLTEAEALGCMREILNGFRVCF